MSSITTIPQILDNSVIKSGDIFPLDLSEQKTLKTARKLFDAEFYPQSLLEMWNAASNNIRRRIEAYGIDLFESVVADESGRKKINKSGETINERWESVDDYVLIQGAKKLGLISKKATKGLEMVNWMRSHASSAHGSDEEVGSDEVIGLATILGSSLFNQPLPDPGHSVIGLFDPVNNSELNEDELSTIQDQIKSYNKRDLRTAFGFLFEKLVEGKEPACGNATELLIFTWNFIDDDLKKVAGHKFYTLQFGKAEAKDEDLHEESKTRILEFLIKVKGISYIPDAARAKIFRKLARKLSDAKDTSYGWGAEERSARSLAQFGVCVPSIAFEEVYQEILAVYCGNYYGRSGAGFILDDFIFKLKSDQLRKLVKLFEENERVKEELFQKRPKSEAIELLNQIKDRFTIESHKNEVEDCIKKVKRY